MDCSLVTTRYVVGGYAACLLLSNNKLRSHRLARVVSLKMRSVHRFERFCIRKICALRSSRKRIHSCGLFARKQFSQIFGDSKKRMIATTYYIIIIIIIIVIIFSRRIKKFVKKCKEFFVLHLENLWDFWRLREIPTCDCNNVLYIIIIIIIFSHRIIRNCKEYFVVHLENDVAADLGSFPFSVTRARSSHLVHREPYTSPSACNFVRSQQWDHYSRITSHRSSKQSRSLFCLNKWRNPRWRSRSHRSIISSRENRIPR